MAKVLHIVASPRGESYSTRLAGAFLEACRKAAPDDRVEVLDLFRADIPPFHAPQATAKYAVLAGETPRDEAQAAWAGVVRAINHFKGFDRHVISSPVWNFGIPYRLKQYIDVIVQPGLTFSYSPDKGFSGLVTGRPLMLLLASGGSYGPGDPRQTHDFHETYLRAVFGFIGFTDIRTVRIQNTLAGDPQRMEEDLQAAIAQAAEEAPRFARPAPGGTRT